MIESIIWAVSIFLITYASYFAAFVLAGQDKRKSAYWALLPAVAALGTSFMPWQSLKYVVAVISAFCGFFALFSLSRHNVIISAASDLLAVSFCLLGQIVYATFFTGILHILIEGTVYLLAAGALTFFNITIFPENYILTKEQKKNTVQRQVYFFPGLVLLVAWQIFFLTSMNALSEYGLPLFIFTVLLQLTVILLLRQQVHGLQERIENIIDKQYQAELLNFMQVIRSQRHDFNFHTQTICGMIESGRYEECRAYAQSMLQTVKSTNDILPLFHPAASALLNTFREMALQKGLQMDIEIHDNLQFIASGVYETNTILGNLLQNAIDELELHPEIESRVIHVLIIKRGSNNVIKVSNQCHLAPDEMSKIFIPGFTTKKSHEGLGLANALRIAEKYDGTVYPEFEGQTIHFIAKLPMK